MTTGRMTHPVGAVACVAAVLAAAPVAAQQRASIVGTVTAAGATPIAGAQVLLPTLGRAVQTGTDGTFRIRDVPPGATTLRAERLGYAPVERSVVVPAGGEVRVDLTLTEQPVQLAGLVVSVTREAQRLNETAAAVGAISGRELQATRPTHPAEVMSQIPGVRVNVTSGEGHMMSIRMPMTTDPVYLYLENGVPIRSTGFFNHNALYEVDLPQAARIEVLKGPASALYGSDAIGGVIDVETRRPTESPTASAYAEGGAFGYARLLLSGSDTWGRDGLRTDVDLTHTDGWREGTGYDRQSATLRWDRELAGGSSMRTILSAARIDQQTAGASALLLDDYLDDPTLNYTPISYRNVRTVRLSSAIQKQAGASLFSVTPYARWNEMEILPNWSLTYDPTVFTTGNSSAGVLAKVRQDFEPLRARLIAGVDVDYSPGGHRENRIVPTKDGQVFTAYTTGDLVYDYDVTFHSVSPYVQAEASPTDRLHLSAGLRYDRMGFAYDDRLEPLQTGRWRRPADTNVSYRHLSPKLGAAYEFGDALNVYANYNQGFRTPSESQLFRQGPALNTVDLTPVTADSYEAGLRGQAFDRLSYTLAAYHMTVANDIVTYIRPDGQRETQNAGETLHRGVELGLGIAWSDALRTDVSYSYAKHTYEHWSPAAGVDYGGNEEEAAPNVTLDARLTYTPPSLRGGRVALEWNRVGSYWMDAENTHRYGGYDLFNLHANVPLGSKVEVVGRVLNVLDARYAETAQYTQARGEEFAPGAPRSFDVAVQYRWQR
jgi:outer membrane receptor protein involved in Fe transport